MDRNEILSIKKKQLDKLREYRSGLYKAPQLRQLFFELTLRCNSACFHCGSRCTPQSPDGLPAGEYLRVLDQVKEQYGNRLTQVCLTGGEPLLYKDFFTLAQEIHERGFRWGMTSNGTLISRDIARRLRETGMGTISISVDGLPETHDRLRGMPGGFERTMEGVQNLIEEGGFHAIQVTTVINHQNIEELAPIVIANKRKIFKGVSPNIDFFSGFVYEMLGIPVELYTAVFAIARIAGWSAHRIEELTNRGKIIRPAYRSVMEEL